MTTLLRVLIAKDLRRVRRNPLPWLIFLLVPLFAVGLIGAIFGGGGSAKLGHIRLGVVDEDDSAITRFVRQAGNGGDGERQLETVVLDRAAALARLNDNKLSAVVIIPKDFTRDYLLGRPTKLELVKNPAESINPTVIEEAAGLLVAALNGLSRNFSAQFPEIRAAFDNDRSLRGWSTVLRQFDEGAERLRAAGRPALVWYEPPAGAEKAPAAAAGSGFNLFGTLLLGMGAMFLLFLGGIGMSDLHREVEMRTLERFQTVRDSLAPLLVGKVVTATLLTVLCAGILFGGGAAIFGIQWKHPAELLVLMVAYILFVTGLMALIVGWVPEQRKSDALRTMVSMLLGMAGGCAFPLDNAGAYSRWVLPLMPTHWFVSTARTLEYGSPPVPWFWAALKLLLAAAVCLGLASFFLRRRFLQGGRA